MPSSLSPGFGDGAFTLLMEMGLAPSPSSRRWAWHTRFHLGCEVKLYPYNILRSSRRNYKELTGESYINHQEIQNIYRRSPERAYRASIWSPTYKLLNPLEPLGNPKNIYISCKWQIPNHVVTSIPMIFWSEPPLDHCRLLWWSWSSI